MKALIIAAVDIGCRQGELLRLSWRDVDFQSNTLEVISYKGKTVSKRIVLITVRLRDALLDLRTKPSSSAFRKLRTGEKADQTLVFGVVDNFKHSFEAVGKEAAAGARGVGWSKTRITPTRYALADDAGVAFLGFNITQYEVG